MCIYNMEQLRYDCLMFYVLDFVDCVMDNFQPCVLVDEAQLSLCVEDCHRVS